MGKINEKMLDPKSLTKSLISIHDSEGKELLYAPLTKAQKMIAMKKGYVLANNILILY